METIATSGSLSKGNGAGTLARGVNNLLRGENTPIGEPQIQTDRLHWIPPTQKLIHLQVGSIKNHRLLEVPWSLSREMAQKKQKPEKGTPIDGFLRPFVPSPSGILVLFDEEPLLHRLLALVEQRLVAARLASRSASRGAKAPHGVQCPRVSFLEGGYPWFLWAYIRGTPKGIPLRHIGGFPTKKDTPNSLLGSWVLPFTFLPMRKKRFRCPNESKVETPSSSPPPNN